MLKWYRVGIVYRVAVKNLKKKTFSQCKSRQYAQKS